MTYPPLRIPTLLAVVLLGLSACGGGAAAGLRLAPPDPARGYADWMNDARLARARGDWETAERALRHAIDRAPDNPAPYAQLGELRASAGLADEAEAAFRAARSVDPDFRPARDGYAWFLLAQGRAGEARELTPVGGRRFEDLHLRGAVEIATGNVEGGKGTLREAKALADRLQGSVPADAITDVDCRLASLGDPRAVCPRGPVHGGSQE